MMDRIDAMQTLAAAHNAHVPKRITRKLRVGQWEIKYERRHKDELWGRFGGGWNWHIGIQSGGSAVIIFLLVATLSFRKKPIEPCLSCDHA